MIRIGIFGDQTTSHELVYQLNTVPGVVVSGLYLSGDAIAPEGFPELHSPMGLIDCSDAILVLVGKNTGNELVKMLLRKSKPSYFKLIPNLHISELKEIIDLEKEAGVVTFVHNPFLSCPFFDTEINSSEKPFLVNIRTCFEGGSVRLTDEVLLLVSAATRLVQSNYKKIDLFGSRHLVGQLVVHLRIEYENGSVVNLTLTQQKVSGFCEIFQQNGRSFFEFTTPLYACYHHPESEFTAIKSFIDMAKRGDLKARSFDSLANSFSIVHELKEHLRFKGISF